MPRTLAPIMASTIPITYMSRSTGECHLVGKNAGIMRAYIGSLAPQLISGTTSMVIIRLRMLSKVRVAMIAGTEHPNPKRRGMKLLPCSPIRCMRRSVTNAARAMYPEYSRNAIARNSSIMLGKNTMTPPTPPITPSTSIDLTSSSLPSGHMPSTPRDSIAISHSRKAIAGSPSLKVMVKTRYIRRRNIGIPRIR